MSTTFIKSQKKLQALQKPSSFAEFKTFVRCVAYALRVSVVISANKFRGQLYYTVCYPKEIKPWVRRNKGFETVNRYNSRSNWPTNQLERSRSNDGGWCMVIWHFLQPLFGILVIFHGICRPDLLGLNYTEDV